MFWVTPLDSHKHRFLSLPGGSIDLQQKAWFHCRVTHQSYATRIDKIAECQSSTPEPPLTPPLLVQAGRMEESSSKQRPQDEGNNQCNSAVYSKQASGVSEIVTMAENAQTQSQSAMEEGLSLIHI